MNILPLEIYEGLSGIDKEFELFTKILVIPWNN